MRKAVLLAGGHGKRMFPATPVFNKHLLPVYSNQGAVPFLYYPIHTLIKSGFDKILIISSQEHCGDIINHFGDGDKFKVDFTYKIQDLYNPKKPIGIAGALKLARDFINEDKFALILGDNFFEETFIASAQNFENSVNCVHLFLKEVEDINRFGCAAVENGKIVKIIEKPKDAPSNLAVTGLYFFTPDVFNELNYIKVSSRGELEISDINDYYVNLDKVEYTTLNGFWLDAGIPSTMMKTQEFILRNDFQILNNFGKD